MELHATLYVCVCGWVFKGDLLLTYSLPVIPEERSLSISTVTQGNDQS